MSELTDIGKSEDYISHSLSLKEGKIEIAEVKIVLNGTCLEFGIRI